MPVSASRIVVRTVLLLAFPLALVAQPSKSVDLTAAQKQTLRTLQADSAAKTSAVLAKLTELAKAFNVNLFSDKPDPELDRKLSEQMAEGLADVIRFRLERIHSAAKALTPEQRSALAAELKKPDSPYLFDDLVQKVFGDSAK